jgi:hypothetical protein
VVKVVAIAAVAALALLASGSASSRLGAPSGCPSGALPISGTNPIGAAIAAALRKVPASEKPQTQGALMAIADRGRGPQVGTQCGRQARSRTIIVYIARRAYWPSSSASSGVYFVSRFPAGYRVWQVAH